MAKKETKMPLPKIYLDDDLFSTQEQRDDKLKEKVVNISLNDIAILFRTNNSGNLIEPILRSPLHKGTKSDMRFKSSLI